MPASKPLVFVSHSSSDNAAAEALVALLRNALDLIPAEIRCTSVEGYRLPIGVDTDEHLRDELLEVPIFLALISANSLASAYVLFEMGGRWGAKKHLLPLLAPGMSPKDLRGPLTGLNALSCESEEQLHQLLHDIGRLLRRIPNQPAVYLPSLRSLRGSIAPQIAPSRPSRIPDSTPGAAPSTPSEALTEEELRVLDLFARHDNYSFSESQVAAMLKWKPIRARHVVDLLTGREHLNRGLLGYRLTAKGRAVVVTLGLGED